MGQSAISAKLDGIADVSRLRMVKGDQFWVVAAERSHAGRFTVRAGEMRTAFLELQAAIYRRFEPKMESHA